MSNKMPILILLLFIFTQNSRAFDCPMQNKKKAELVYSVQTKDGLYLGLCGKAEALKNNFSNFRIYFFNESKTISKSIYSSSNDTQLFLALNTPKGLTLIEKIEADKKYVELFKHEITCDAQTCDVKKDQCLVFDNIKLKKIVREIKDKKIVKRLKKAGCFKT